MIREFACWLTTAASGAVGVLHMRAQPDRLAKTLSITLPEIGNASLRRICDLDEALVLRASDNTLIVTPHGGPRLRQRLVRAISDAGISFVSPNQLTPADIFIETANDIESRMLNTLSRAASPDAIALLLAQPQRWKKYGAPTPADAARSKRLCRLIDPPTVVIAGAPNAGKSTLLNALLGRTAAVTSPIAGTTRDFVSANIVLAGLACRVVDAPGFIQKNLPEKFFGATHLTPSHESIDQAAIARAQQEILNADLVVALAAPNQEWPAIEHLNIIRVQSMSDILQSNAAKLKIELRISALTHNGLNDFSQAVREKLVPASEIISDRPWQFW